MTAQGGFPARHQWRVPEGPQWPCESCLSPCQSGERHIRIRCFLLWSQHTSNIATAGNAVCMHDSFLTRALTCVAASTGAAPECKARIWKAAQSPSGVCCHWHRSPAHMHKPGERATYSRLLSPPTLSRHLLLPCSG